MKFYIVDVFAEQKYQGNQLAVLIPDCELSTDQMQQIAREINFSETSFIMSGKLENGGYNVRIFTPDIEVPFAGHPTLGTAYVINKIVEGYGEKRVVLNLGVGQISVSINEDEFIMTQNEPSFGMVIDRPDVVADVLKIKAEDIRTDYPIQLVSTGLPCIIVPLKTIDALKSCSIDHDKFRVFFENYYKCNLLVFTQPSDSEKCDLRVRVFMDDPGFFEDPATGSANGNLAGYLLKYNFFNSSKLSIIVNQGEEINRPSRISVLADMIDDKFHINIGGKSFLVAEGEWKHERDK